MIVERYFAVDVQKPLKVQGMTDMLVAGDRNAHRFHVTLTKHGELVEAVGNVTAYYLRPDGRTVVLRGETSGNDVSVLLPAGCYEVPGWAQLLVKLISGESVTTVLALDTQVMISGTGELVDPEHVVPSLDELLGKIADLERATADAERVSGPMLNELAQLKSDYAQQGVRIDDVEYDVDKVVSSFPDELKSDRKEKENLDITWENGYIDPSTGNVIYRNHKITSEPVYIGNEIVATLENGADVKYWIRVFDESGAYIGTCQAADNGNAVSGSSFASYSKLIIDTVHNVFSNAKYVRLVATVGSNTDLPIDVTGSHITFNGYRTINSPNGKPLDGIYARKSAVELLENAVADTEREFSEVSVQVNNMDTVVAAHDSNIEKIKDSLPEDLYTATQKVVPYLLTWENGYINPSTGELIVRNHKITSSNIPVDAGVTVTLDASEDRKYWIRVFNSSNAYIGSCQFNANGIAVNGDSATNYALCKIDTVPAVYPAAAYVRLVDTVASNMDTPIGVDESKINATTVSVTKELNGKSLDSVYMRDATRKLPKTTDQEPLTYPIDADGHYTNGKLKLPPNYTTDGVAVPLIVFIHGSGDYGGLNEERMTDMYDDLYNFLRDNGYAVFDCFGWGNVYAEKYGIRGASTWGTPTNTKCYVAGIRYVLEHYNVDGNNIFVSSKSLGGIQALAMCYQREVKINAVGMLAPELDILKIVSPFGYQRGSRCMLAEDMGFDDGWEAVLNVSDTEYNRDNAKAFLATQKRQLNAYNPAWKNMLIPTEDKLTISFTFSPSVMNQYMTAQKPCDTPFKIWCAEDDPSVSGNAANLFVTAVQNAGGDAMMRWLPAGTGGHHAVDTDPNALKVEHITTRCGIAYTDVALAYVEMEEYFHKHMLR